MCWRLMRQPLEDGERDDCAGGDLGGRFLLDYLLAAAMNPCRCGVFGIPRHDCHCTQPMIQRYCFRRFRGRCWTGLIFTLEVPAVKYKELRAPSSSEDSAGGGAGASLIAARQRQTERFKGGRKATYCKHRWRQMIRKELARINRGWGEVLLENAVISGWACRPRA